MCSKSRSLTKTRGLPNINHAQACFPFNDWLLCIVWESKQILETKDVEKVCINSAALMPSYSIICLKRAVEFLQHM